MKKINLTKTQVRKFLLYYHNLTEKTVLSGETSIVDYIKKVGCIQYDPLNVVGNNPSLVLQSRIQDFSPQKLYDLLYKKRKLIEHWDKQMSIYHVNDFPFLKQLRKIYFERHKKTNDLLKIISEVKKSVTTKGPLSSRNINYEKNVFWSWGKANIGKASLESLYWRGDLIVHHRKHTCRYYDLIERHLSKELINGISRHKTENDYFDWFVLRRIGSSGIAPRRGDHWVGMRGINSSSREKAFERLLKSDKIIEVYIKNMKSSFFLRTEDMFKLNKALECSIGNKTSFIAPLDNLIWNRDFIEELFDFYYRWEVYTPITKRQYGYYVLPVIYKDKFIARVEPVLNKNSNELIIKNWWWEKGIILNEKMEKSIKVCLKDFAKYLGVNFNYQAVSIFEKRREKK